MKKTHRAVVAWALIFSFAVGICFSGHASAASAPSLFYNDERWHRDSSAGLEVIDGIYYVPVDIFGMLSQVELLMDSRSAEFMVYNRTSKRYITVLFHQKIATVNGEEEVYLNFYQLHGGYYYVPAEYFCEVLALSCEVQRSSSSTYGVTLRISDGGHTLSMKELLSGYDPADSTTADTSTTLPSTEPPVTSGADTVARTTFLTFNSIAGEGLPAILDALKDTGVRATFFFTAEELRTAPDRVIDVVAGGHLVALTCESADTVADFLEQMESANDILCGIVKLRTHIVQLPGGTAKSGFSEEELTQLGAAGYVLWDWTYDVPDSVGYRASYVTSLCQRAITKSEINVLRMSCNETVAQLLPDLLDFLTANPNYTVMPLYIGVPEVRFAAQ